MKKILRRQIQRLGFDVYRYPAACERLIPHLRMLLPVYNVDTIIDVGANVGQFASEMRSLARDSWIHSIEPNPLAYKTLEAMTARDLRWTAHECALGRASGRITLNVFSASDFSSCLSANQFGTQRFSHSLKAAGAVEVELRTLDELVGATPLSEIGSRLLLKLDTQGFDMEVLAGAASTLERVQIVVTEVSLRPIYQGAPLFPEVLEFMSTKGFKLSGFFPVSRSADLSIIESDSVFVRVVDH